MLSESEIKAQQASELDRLIKYVGSQSALAAQLGVSRQTVTNWVARGRISATMATKVEVETKGLFLRKSMRPDVASWAEIV